MLYFTHFGGRNNYFTSMYTYLSFFYSDSDHWALIFNLQPLFSGPQWVRYVNYSEGKETTMKWKWRHSGWTVSIYFMTWNITMLHKSYCIASSQETLHRQYIVLKILYTQYGLHFHFVDQKNEVKVSQDHCLASQSISNRPRI